MKVISLFNHKGGVSKTTTTFNLGWMLAEKGYKTLIVDADPQCNLTALVLGYNSVNETENLYQPNQNHDIYSCIKPVLDGSLGKILPANPLKTDNPNLFLLCGNIELSETETQISVALTTSNAIPAIRNIPGSINALIRDTAIKQKIDYVLIDMSPSVGALNQCLLMASDFFIVPTAPDFFCAQAIKSLTNVIPKWNNEIIPFRNPELIYPFPSNSPKFIGFISQKYRPRNGAPAKSFQRWIDIINSEVSTKLVPELSKYGMSVSKADFLNITNLQEPYNLSNIADFNSLIAESQNHSTPVFSLTDDQIGQAGVILNNMKESRDGFKYTFEKLAMNTHELASKL